MPAMVRTNIFGLLKLGARVTLVGPSTLVPREFEKLGVAISHKIEDVLPKADVVNLLRIQHERQRREYFPGLGEYIHLFGLTKERAKLLKPDCLIMHPARSTAALKSTATSPTACKASFSTR